MALSDSIADWMKRHLLLVANDSRERVARGGDMLRPAAANTPQLHLAADSFLGTGNWLKNWVGHAVMVAAGVFNLAGRYAESAYGQTFQSWDAYYRPQTLSAADAITAWKTGHIAPDVCVRYLRLAGLDEEAIGVLTGMAYVPLPPETALDLLRREELTPEAFRAEMKGHGFTQAQTAMLEGLQRRTLNPADLVTFLHREAFEPEQVVDLGLDQGFDDGPRAAWPVAKRYFQEAGLTKDQANLFWRAGWNPIGVQQAFDAWHRGALRESDVDAILLAHDFTPKFAPALKALSYDLPTLVDLRRGLQMGVLTPVQVRAQLERRGYTPDDAAWLTQFYVNLTAGTLPQSKRKELSTAAVLNALDDGLLTPEDATAELVGLKYHQDDAELLVQDAVYKRDTRIVKLWISAVEDYYRAGDLTDDEVRERLVELGVPENEAHALSEKWIAARYAAGDKLTEKQIEDALTEGILTLEQAANELARRGVTPRQRYVKLVLWGISSEDATNALGLSGPPTQP